MRLRILLGLACLVAVSCGPGGVAITVRNVGSETLHGAVLHVTGRDYPLGDLPPGSTRTAIARPTGDSHAELSFRDAQGTPQRLTVGCYFGPGFRGTLDIDLDSSRVHGVRDRVRITGY